MIKITWTVNPTTIENMRRKGPRIVAVLMAKMTVLMYQLSSYIQSTKLSGQVLGVRTGILRSSVHAIPATAQGTRLTAAVEAAGGPAFYGRIFENGGKSTYTILATKKRALSFIMDGKRVFAKSVNHPALKARPFMKPSEDENRAKIFKELNDAVNRVVQEP
jgi:hypothetical protein